MDKAAASGADALTLDLEDAVPTGEKDNARRITSEFLCRRGNEVWCSVRVAPIEDRRCYDDIAAVVRAGACGVTLPKVESPDDVLVCDRILGWHEEANGLAPGSIAIIPAFESAAALLDAARIAAASPRVALTGPTAGKGGDVERSIGYRWTAQMEESLVLRSLGLLAMRAAGVPNPLTGLWTEIRDLAGLQAFAEQSREIGYDGMVVIHPSHVAVANAAFTVADVDLDYYEELVAALEAAEREGRAAITFRGEMIDIAMKVRAMDVLAAAGVRPAVD